MDLSTFYNQFREETTENLRILSDGLMALESGLGHDHPDGRAHIDAIFRAVHTIKGSARLLGFEAIGRVAHAMENILGAVRDGQRSLTRSLADDLLQGGDAILELTSAALDSRPAQVDVTPLIHRLEHGENVPAPPVAMPAQASPPTPSPSTPGSPGSAPVETPTPTVTAVRSNNRQTVRVRVDRLDRLINLTGELVVGQQVLAAHVQALHELHALLVQQERALLSLDATLRSLRFSPSQRQTLDQHLNGLLNRGEQTMELLNQQVDQLGGHVEQQGFLVGDLEQEVMAVRLLPVSTVFANLPRAVRDLARATDKSINLELLGENTEIDRKVLEILSDPLLHLVRNAVDHGIEAPDERVAQGKPRDGRIRVSAEASGGEVRIGISDDGRGMQPQKLRDIAVRKGLISAEQAALLSDQEALELIFLPGFTSAALITDISGRGVGMDVVRSNISELGGQVLIESQPGQGTQITLVLPLTLVTTRIVLVEIGAQTFALPASGCRGSIWVYRDQVRTVEGQALIEHEGRAVSLLRLADMLGVEGAPLFHNRERMPALILGSGQRLIGIIVDRLLDEREAVVKPLGLLFAGLRRYGGAVQLGDGKLVLLLNPVALVQTARGMVLTGTTAMNSKMQRRHHLLIADDSFTTRELMRSILQSAGYQVTAAVDGFDALDKLRAQSYDLVLSDVEMPRVNGFELTARIRGELKLDDLPVIIMTSLASEAHRRQGLEAGAQAYIVKSQFNQDNLLEIIQQLLGSTLVSSS